MQEPFTAPAFFLAAMLLLTGYYERFLGFLQGHLLACPSRRYLHIDCPGCGLQRSILALLRGDLAGSLHYHPAGILVLLTFVLLPLQLIFRFTWGGKVLLGLQVAVVIITITFYVYKIIHHQIAN